MVVLRDQSADQFEAHAPRHAGKRCRVAVGAECVGPFEPKLRPAAPEFRQQAFDLVVVIAVPVRIAEVSFPGTRGKVHGKQVGRDYIAISSFKEP